MTTTNTPNFTPGEVYELTFVTRPDPRRPERTTTRRLRYSDSFTVSGRVYFYFYPVRNGARVCIAASEIREVVR